MQGSFFLFPKAADGGLIDIPMYFYLPGSLHKDCYFYFGIQANVWQTILHFTGRHYFGNLLSEICRKMRGSMF